MALTGVPFTSTLPRMPRRYRWSPWTSRSSVDFPLPLGPMMATSSPEASEAVTPRKIRGGGAGAGPRGESVGREEEAAAVGPLGS